MANVEMTIQLLETFRDRDMWKEGFMTHEDKPKTRKNICGYAIETIKAQQAEIERLNALLKEQEEVEGHWIPIESPTGVEAFGIKEMTVQDVRCSVCDAEEDVSFVAYRFCPRCGAKMKGR